LIGQAGVGPGAVPAARAAGAEALGEVDMAKAPTIKVTARPLRGTTGLMRTDPATMKDAFGRAKANQRAEILDAMKAHGRLHEDFNPRQCRCVQ
jgi:hypothetical protein